MMRYWENGVWNYVAYTIRSMHFVIMENLEYEIEGRDYTVDRELTAGRYA